MNVFVCRFFGSLNPSSSFCRNSHDEFVAAVESVLVVVFGRKAFVRKNENGPKYIWLVRIASV